MSKSVSDDKKEDKKVSLFYIFTKRPVPEGLGTIDKVSNMLRWETTESQWKDSYNAVENMDVEIKQIPVRMLVFTLQSKDDNGYSISLAINELRQRLSIGSVVNPVGVITFEGITAAITQAHTDLKADLRIETYTHLSNGTPIEFSQFTEQLLQQTTTTQTAVTQGSQTRRVGMEFKITPYILKDRTYLSYSISNTQPDTTYTQYGSTVVGNVDLPEKGACLIVDSVRVREQKDKEHVLFIPTGFNKQRVYEEDVVVLMRSDTPAKVPLGKPMVIEASALPTPEPLPIKEASNTAQGAARSAALRR